MKNRYLNSIFSATLSILPIVMIVFILSWAQVSPLTGEESIVLVIGAVALILGLAIFQIGASTGLTKVGEYMGASLSKQKKLFVVIIFAFLLGTLITCAEPSILIVSTQININKYILIGSIAVGVGIFVVIGILRIFYQKSLKVWYLFFYFIVFSIICLLQIDPRNAPYLPFIFDAGGITTGSATVPFILALGAGAAAVRGGKNANEDSFGLVGLASVGPIITMTILILSNSSGFKDYTVSITTGSIWDRFANALLYTSPTSMGSLIDVIMALAPILVIFFVYDFLFIHLPFEKVFKLLIGFLFSYIGLVLFLTGVGAAMSPLGLKLGQRLGFQPNYVIIILAFIIGLVTILCEPAVHVLTNQIEAISNRRIKKKTVLLSLSIGVGIAICLSAIRTLFNFSIMYYIIPGYVLSVILMFVNPNIFTAIAFDSGGTASGPMAVSFVLPMIIGITSNRNGISDAEWQSLPAETQALYGENINGIHCLLQSKIFYEQSFGVVAMIALTPILAIQILGVVLNIKKYMKLRVMRSQSHDESNFEIINF